MRIDRSLKRPRARGMRPLGLALGCACAALGACGHRRPPYVARVRETGGVLVSIAAWGPDSLRLERAVGAALDSAAAAVTSLTAAGDRTGTVAVSPALARLAVQALELARSSRGAFDPTGRHFSGFSVDTLRDVLTLPRGSRLSLGELGRGYALDRALAALRGVADSAVISSGGQYLIHADWSGARVVGIVNPDKTQEPVARLTVPAGTWAVSTVSVAEARDELLDPRTGKPATRARVVAAMAPRAALAGGWAAAFYVVGCDSALMLAPRAHASVICADGAVRWSADLDGRVTTADSVTPAPQR